MGLFHLTTEAHARISAEGPFTPPDFEVSRCVPVCADKELLAVAERIFGGRADVVVLSLREDLLDEKAAGGRLRRPIPRAAIVEVVALPLEEGRFTVPVDWRPWRHFFV